MNEPNGIAVFAVGITTVFVIFVILYFIFRFMALITIRGNKKAKTTSSFEQVKQPYDLMQKATANAVQQNGNVELYEPKQNEEGEEIAAVFAAIYTVMGEDVSIRSIYRKENVRSTSGAKGRRDWVEWRNHGWRGGNRW